MRTAVKRFSTVCLALGLATASLMAQTPDYGVKVTADRKVDFSRFKSYTWDDPAQKAADKAVHQGIMDAVDREMKAVGLEKRESGPADLKVTYGSLSRTDVDLKSKGKNGELREYAVGSLVVILQDFGTRKEVFRARADTPIDAQPDKMQATLDHVVTEMFAKYPARPRQ